MSVKGIIKKALFLNDVVESDVTVVETENHHYLIHIFEIIVLLLDKFAFAKQIKSDEIFDFIMRNFEAILDSVLIEIQIAVFNFDNLFGTEIQVDVIELHNKDECYIVATIQNRFYQKIKNLV